MGRLEKLTEEDRAWLCSCSSYAKTKKPELIVMATSNVKIMMHNLRFEIEELRDLIQEASEYLDTNELTNIGHGSILHRKFKDVLTHNTLLYDSRNNRISQTVV